MLDGTRPTCIPNPCDFSIDDVGVNASGCDGATTTDTCEVSCALGYSGTAETFTCQPDATLSGTVPTCTANPCNNTIDEVDLDPSDCDTARTSDTCNVSCAMGYSGMSETFTCHPDASLGGVLPMCTPDECNNTITGDHINATGCDGVRTAETCGVTCAPTHLATPDPAQWECQPDGSITGTLPTCTPIYCDLQTIVGVHLNRSTCEAVIATETCSIGCSLGWHAEEETTYTCNRDGTYTGSPPVCQPVPCTGRIGGVGVNVSRCNGTVTEQDCSVGCAAGYGGQAETFTCMYTGHFTGSTPVCEPRQCTGIPSFTNAVTDSCAGAKTDEDCIAECDEGYKSMSSLLKCMPDGSVKGEAPTCNPIRCDTSSITGQYLNTNSCSGKRTGETCSVTCKQGYGTASSVFTCSNEETFTGTAPSCSPAACNAAPFSTVGVDASNCVGKTTTEACLLKCAQGYSGDVTLAQCTDSGAFFGSPPRCTANKCVIGSQKDAALNLTLCSSTSTTQTCTAPCGQGWAGAATTLRCLPNGTFVETIADRKFCVPADCSNDPEDLPIIVHGNVSHCLDLKHRNGGNATDDPSDLGVLCPAKCKVGYKAQQNAGVYCAYGEYKGSGGCIPADVDASVPLIREQMAKLTCDISAAASVLATNAGSAMDPAWAKDNLESLAIAAAKQTNIDSNRLVLDVVPIYTDRRLSMLEEGAPPGADTYRAALFTEEDYRTARKLQSDGGFRINIFVRLEGQDAADAAAGKPVANVNMWQARLEPNATSGDSLLSAVKTQLLSEGKTIPTALATATIFVAAAVTEVVMVQPYWTVVSDWTTCSTAGSCGIQGVQNRTLKCSAGAISACTGPKPEHGRSCVALDNCPTDCDGNKFKPNVGAAVGISIAAFVLLVCCFACISFRHSIKQALGIGHAPVYSEGGEQPQGEVGFAMNAGGSQVRPV